MVSVIKAQHAKLTPSRLQQLRANLGRLHRHTGGKLLLATGCSGTDLIFKVVADLVSIWCSFFGLVFEVVHLFSCDHGPLQQEFIKAHWEPQALFNSLEEVGSSSMAFDVLSGELKPVPSAFLWATGIECDTLSGLNRSRRVGDSVIEKGEGKTGTSATYCMRYVETRRPPVLLFECVKNLGSSSKAGPSTVGKQSDLDFLIELANKSGYIMLPASIQATDYGFPSSRPRFYVLGVLCRGSDETFSQLPQAIPDQLPPAVSEFDFPFWWHDMQNCLEDLKCDPLPVSRFFLPLGDIRRLKSCKFPQFGSIDKPRSGRTHKGDVQWETDHLTKYQEAKLPWPPTFSVPFASKTSHLSERPAQIVHYHEQILLESLVPPPASPCLDINFNINWGSMQYGATPCLVGSSKVWWFTRSLSSDDVPVGYGGLELAAEEALGLQGFSICSQNAAFMDEHTPQEPARVLLAAVDFRLGRSMF